VILIIDDSREFADVLARELERRGFTVRAAHSGHAGLALAAEVTPRLVFVDLRMSDLSGLEVVRRLKAAEPELPIVIVTAYPELQSALAAIKGQVLDYLCKPFAFEALDETLRRVFGDASGHAPADGTGPERMVGVSKATEDVRHLVTQLAHSGVRAALITGESGTGKELVARLFHDAGARRRGPFVEVNCSAVTESLFESEFFGHERGAFTGAVTQRRGYAELADGGTLFLDEVAEIPLACQPKLLRFLENQTFMRVGGGRKLKVDVRIVAATNRDLRAMVEQWTFRADLYFRLNVVPIEVAPLRARLEDIVPLARHWLAEANRRYGRRVRGFTPAAETLLMAYTWPGNVRELRNLVERLAILAPDEEIDVTDLPAELRGADGGAAAVAAGLPTLEELERAHIQRVLARVDGNKTKAAELLGVNRTTLRKRAPGHH